MASYLRKEEFVEFAPEYEGMIHINHDLCDAGLDTKRRLYIRRLEDGNIVAYCHHCGKSGYYRQDYSRYHKAKRAAGGTKAGVGFPSGRGKGVDESDKQSDTVHSKRVRLPSDGEGDTSKWHLKAKAWLLGYGITQEEVEKYGIVYSDSDRRIVFPVYTGGDLSLLQRRRIFDDDTRPKYITVKKNGGVFFAGCPVCSGVTKLCIVTEDIVSAIKCSRYADAYAILGSMITDEGLAQILKNQYDKALIFLDDDNRQVKMDQIVLKNKLELYIDEVVIIKSNGRDPKDHTDEELRRIIDGYI